MRTIKTKTLKEGMKFEKGVFINDDTLIIAPNVPLKQKDIDRLIRWDIEEVQTDGAILTGDDSLQSPVDDTSEEYVHDNALLSAYVYLIEELNDIFLSIQQAEEVDKRKIDSNVQELIATTQKNRNDLIQLVCMGRKPEGGLSVNPVNSTILAIVIGSAMKFSGHKLFQLGVSALFHDIGMLRVPANVIQKEGKLNPTEINIMKTHTIHSYVIMQKELHYPEEVAVVGIQHHERWDGNGYPRRLRGESISLPARVVTVADAFVAMISKRSYRDSMIGYYAMRSILNDNNTRFDPAILKAFARSMGIFPIGSIVQLNTGGIGRVVDINEQAPLRPKVEVFLSNDGSKLSKSETIDLVGIKDNYITRAVDPKEL